MTPICASAVWSVAHAGNVPAENDAVRLIAAAERQIGVTVRYDPAYQSIGFPGGDVAEDRGVCTDVIIRAYRSAFGFDLQREVNADMAANFSAYPKTWGLARPDPSIDHRRVPNLQVFFARRGAELARPATPGAWLPGDLVTQTVAKGLPHIAIVSATLNPAGQHPMVIHNIGRGTVLEDTLGAFPVTGRYRFLA